MTAVQLKTRYTLETGLPGADASRPGMVERITEILDTFQGSSNRLLLEDIAARTGLPRSTTFRILSQLTQFDWLVHDASGYRLGRRAQGLTDRARPATDVDDLREAASTVLNELHAATGGVAHLSVLEGANVRYLDKIGGAVASTIPIHLRRRIPAVRTATGRAILATLEPETVDVLLAGTTDLQGRPVDLAVLHPQLQRVRTRRGLAVERYDYRSGRIVSIAAPVMTRHGAIAAIAVTGAEDFPVERVAPMVSFAARRIAQEVDPRPSRG